LHQQQIAVIVTPQLQQQLKQKKLLQQLQQPLLQKVAATLAATVAATITTAVPHTVISYVQNGIDIFRKQIGVNVDPTGIGWV